MNMKHRPWFIAAFALVLFCLVGHGRAIGAESADAQSWKKLHALIKPAAGESRWMEIDWHPNVWEARRIAAEQGKPLLLMAGSGGAPAAGC